MYIQVWSSVYCGGYDLYQKVYSGDITGCRSYVANELKSNDNLISISIGSDFGCYKKNQNTPKQRARARRAMDRQDKEVV